MDSLSLKTKLQIGQFKSLKFKSFANFKANMTLKVKVKVTSFQTVHLDARQTVKLEGNI